MKGERGWLTFDNQGGSHKSFPERWKQTDSSWGGRSSKRLERGKRALSGQFSYIANHDLSKSKMLHEANRRLERLSGNPSKRERGERGRTKGKFNSLQHESWGSELILGSTRYIHPPIYLCYSLNSSQIELNYFTECLPYTAHPSRVRHVTTRTPSSFHTQQATRPGTRTGRAARSGDGRGGHR